MKSQMQNVEEVRKLVGQSVLVKATNIGPAVWESGLLEEVVQRPLETESFAYIRMRGKKVHKISLRDFTVKKAPNAQNDGKVKS